MFLLRLLETLGRFGVQFGRPLEFEGSIRRVFLNVFGAVAKTRKTMFFNYCANIAPKAKNIDKMKV
jgi:hypothetical protein